MNELYSVISLKQSYLLSPECLGRKISFSFSDSNITAETIIITILFPDRNPQEKTSLKSPVSEKFLGILSEWGKIDYSGIDSFPYIRTIIVLLKSQSTINTSECRKFLNGHTNRILKALRCLHPYSVERDNEDNSLVRHIAIKSSRLEIDLSPLYVILGRHNDLISIKDIINTIRNDSKVLSLPLQLFDRAIDNQFRLDYRACILNCATLIEILLKRDLERNIKLCVSLESLRNRITKDSNNYDKIKGYLRDISQLPQIDADYLFIIRNRIIHGGYTPLEKDASNVIKTAKEFIDYYHPDLYEE